MTDVFEKWLNSPEWENRKPSYLECWQAALSSRGDAGTQDLLAEAIELFELISKFAGGELSRVQIWREKAESALAHSKETRGDAGTPLAFQLLHEAAEHMEDSSPNPQWWQKYFTLTGQHMIMTDEGWESGESKQAYIDAGNADAILGEVNVPAELALAHREAPQGLPGTETCPTCGHSWITGTGDYSCAGCGMGMAEPCEHWKKMLAASEDEAVADREAKQEPDDWKQAYLSMIAAFRKWCEARGWAFGQSKYIIGLPNDPPMEPSFSAAPQPIPDQEVKS